MIIEKISLRNYRCYRHADIVLVKDNFSLDEPGITLFTGNNSVGKTTIFNAIGWAIYGRETQSILYTEHVTLPIPSVDSFSQDGYSEVKVELFIRDIGNINKAVLTRTAKFKIQAETELDQELTLHLKYDDGTDNLISSKSHRVQVEGFLQQVFPNEIAAFHLFDGEFLERTYTNRGSNIEAGINNLFRIVRIEELKKASKELEEKYGKDRSKYTTDTRLKEKIDLQNLRISETEDLVTKRDNLADEILHLKNERIQTNDEIDQLGNVQAIKDKKDRITFLESEISGIEGKKKQSIQSRRKLILKNSFKLNSAEIYKNAHAKLESMTKRGKIPPDIKDTFIKDLLFNKECICGTELTEGSGPRQTVQSLLEEISDSSESEVLLDLYYSLGNMQKENERLGKEIELAEEEVIALDKQIGDLDRERAVLTESMHGVASTEELVDRYLGLKTLRDEFTEKIERKIAEQTNLNNRIKDLNDEVDDLGEEIRKLHDRNTKYEQYENYYLTAKAYTDMFSEIVRSIFSEIASRYQSKVNELIGLIPLLSQFKVEVAATESQKGNLEFRFLQNGEKNFYMAGGQNQLMGILLIAAFTKVMRESRTEEISAPFVVIDNPVSTLSLENMKLFGRILGNLFEGIHVILFTKNTDFDKILDGAKDSISRFYKLHREDEHAQTRIEEVRLIENQ